MQPKRRGFGGRHNERVTSRRRTKQRRLIEEERRRAEGAADQERIDRRRGIVAEATSMGGIEFEEPHELIVIEPIRLPSGDDLYFQSPFVVPFYLLKSKTLRDEAEPKRKQALAATKREADGTFRPLSSFDAFDALEDLALAVIIAASAIEAHANDMIGRLPDDAMVEVPTRLGGATVAVMRNKAAMDWLPMSDKLQRATPLLHGTESIKGTVAWQKYKRLFRIRNALVHPRREAINDPLKPGPFGRLMLGEGSSAPEEAAAVIEALEPGWLPETIRAEISL
jgi:hypothetical protein